MTRSPGTPRGLASFQEEASTVADGQLRALREGLTYDDALALPAVNPQDVVVAGKQVLLTIYRQADTPLPGHVLVTVQIARHGLGGVLSFHTEKGLVFTPDHPPRHATAEELVESGG